MKVLVTGAAGFFGAHLVRALARSATVAAVIATDLNDAPDPVVAAAWAEGSVSYHRLDVTERGGVRALLDAVRPDAVIHAAAITPVDDQDATEARRIARINAEGSFTLLDCACATPSVQRIVAVSSAAVLGPHSGPSPLAETADADPRSLYGATKLVLETMAARLAAARGRSIACVRLASLYGELERALPTRARTSSVHRLVSATAPVCVAGPDVVKDYLHADDAAGAVVRLLGLPDPHPLYHLGGGEPVGWHRLLAAAETAGIRLRRDVPPEKADILMGARDVRPVMAIDRARAHLGFTPRSIESGLRDLVAEMAVRP